MDNAVKESFQKVKKDIDFLKEEINSLRFSLTETREKIIEIVKLIQEIHKKTEESLKKPQISDSTDKGIIETTSTHLSTDNGGFRDLKPQNLGISTGNGGVSTDRQTDRQTNRQTGNLPEKHENSIENATQILDSLDNIKKEIRLKFKTLTEQEFLVFSAMYQLDEEKGHSDYKTLSDKLSLTESSIRDYVGRIIKKGISVEKNKINNKNIQLTISGNLKKIASLSTILQLRGL